MSRRSSVNTQIRHRKVARGMLEQAIKASLGDTDLKTKMQIVGEAGYAPETSYSDVAQSKNYREILNEERIALLRNLEDEGISTKKIAEKINLLLDNDDYKAVDRGIVHAKDVMGLSAPKKTESETTHKYDFNFGTGGNSDYQEFLNQKRKKLEIESRDKQEVDVR